MSATEAVACVASTLAFALMRTVGLTLTLEVEAVLVVLELALTLAKGATFASFPVMATRASGGDGRSFWDC